MPRFSTWFRLALALGLFLAYRRVPELARRHGDAPALRGIEPTRIAQVTLTGLDAGELTVHRDAANTWWLAGTGTPVAADGMRLAKLLADLATMRFVAAPATTLPPTPPRLVLIDTHGGRAVIELGERRAPFRSQTVRIDGRAGHVDRDLGAALGLWRAESAPSPMTLVDATLYRADGGIVELTLENPFTTYTARRGSDIAVTIPGASPGGPDESVHRWTLEAEGHALRPMLVSFHELGGLLTCLPVAGLPAAGHAPAPAEIYRLTLQTAAGTRLVLAASGSANERGDHRVRIVEPARGALLVDQRTFRAHFPAGRRLAMALPGIETPAPTAIRVAASRAGQRWVLVKGRDGAWAFEHPQVGLPIYRPPPVPGMPPEENLDMAASYLREIAAFAATEHFTVDTAARRALVDVAFARPAAEVLLSLPDGRRATLELSAEVPGTGLRFLRLGERLVVSDYTPDMLVPEPASFLDPEALANRSIAW